MEGVITMKDTNPAVSFEDTSIAFENKSDNISNFFIYAEFSRLLKTQSKIAEFNIEERYFQ